MLRIEETAVGSAMGVVAACLVLPKRSRDAFGDAVDDVVAGADAMLAGSTERILGRRPASPPGLLAQDLHKAVSTLCERNRPLGFPVPWRRGRCSYEHTVRALSTAEHYIRRLAQAADDLDEPGWAPTLRPAVSRVRANLDALRQLPRHRTPECLSAALLEAARVLRRTDQVVVKLATELGHTDEKSSGGSDHDNAQDTDT